MIKLKVASLFCGCGGTDIGFQGGFYFLNQRYKRYPVEIVYANDLDEKIGVIFDENFQTKVDYRDIREISADDIPEHDILTGGFPCQSFSIVAQNPLRLGVESKGGMLFYEMCRILKEKQPLCFVAENVKGILSANKGAAFPLIMKSFRECGYYAMHMLLNAYHYGVPQRRERVFIVGFRKAEHMDRFKPPCPVDVRKVLGDMVQSESEVDQKYYFSEKALEGLRKANKTMNKGRVQDLSEPCNTVGAHLAKVSINSTDPVLRVNGRYRRFTPREVARIQSFPEEFKLTGADGTQYRALGNAIPPVLAWHVAGSIMNSLQS